MNPLDPKELSYRALQVCEKENWGTDWRSRGLYLYLELAEFVEALRGKKGNIASEAGDILFVLGSALAAVGLSLEDAMVSISNKMLRDRGI